MHNLIGDPKALALLAAMGVLSLLCGAFGLTLFLRLRKGAHPVWLTVRNVSIGGVTGGYEFSDTLVLFVCFVLTLGLLAALLLQLRPESKPSPADDGKAAVRTPAAAGSPPNQAPPASVPPQKAGNPVAPVPPAPTGTSMPAESHP